MEKHYPQQAYHRNDLNAVIKKTASQELYSCGLYLALSQHKITKHNPNLNKIATQAFDEDREHFLSIAERFDILNNASVKAHLSTHLSNTAASLKNCDENYQWILDALQQSERKSIAYQETICSMTLGHDYQTFDLAYSLLNDNMQHIDNIELLLNQHKANLS